jgi:hypothetical protein
MRPPAGGRQYIYWHPSLRPSLHPSLRNVAKLIRRRRISLKRDNHPKNPSVRSLHRANATSPRAAHCIANNPRAVQRSAAHCIASCTAQRTARMQPARAQRIASQTIRAPKTSPPRIARRTRCASSAARRTPHTCSACTRFAVLCAGFVWFVVLNFPKFNLYTLRIAFLSCVRSSVGTELGNQALCPGFDSGRKFSDLFCFRHFLQS